MLDDGQTQAGTASFARTTAVNPVKALSQSRQMLRCNAWAGILDAELSTPICQQ